MQANRVLKTDIIDYYVKLADGDFVKGVTQPGTDGIVDKLPAAPPSVAPTKPVVQGTQLGQQANTGLGDGIFRYGHGDLNTRDSVVYTLRQRPSIPQHPDTLSNAKPAPLTGLAGNAPPATSKPLATSRGMAIDSPNTFYNKPAEPGLPYGTAKPGPQPLPFVQPHNSPGARLLPRAQRGTGMGTSATPNLASPSPGTAKDWIPSKSAAMMDSTADPIDRYLARSRLR